MPPEQSCLHAKCGPSEPCLGSHVSLGPGIWPFWGVLAANSPVGDRFCLLGTQPTKDPFWPSLGATGEFSGIFQLIGTAFAFRNFLTLTTFPTFPDVSPEFFEKIAIYWSLEGSGHLEKFRAPTDKKI